MIFIIIRYSRPYITFLNKYYRLEESSIDNISK